MPSAIPLLKSDHVTLKKLLKELVERTSNRAVKQRERLVADIEREVKIHSKIEEEIFYPAFKAAVRKTDDEEMFYEATEEHHVVDMVLPELKATSPKTPEFAAKAKVVRELLEHHIREEETELFPRCREVIEDRELRALGQQMQERKEVLAAEWANPILRPLHKLQSAVDKVLPVSLKNVKGELGSSAKSDRGEAR